MKQVYDMHTHTTYSHGKNSIEEMVEQARELGLKSITISDHGRSHPLYGVRKDKFKEMRNKIDALNAKFTDIKILLSVEANIVGTEGIIDIGEEEKKYCDYIIVGYHFAYKPARLKDFFVFYIPNCLALILPFIRRKVSEMNTRAYELMMDKYDIKLITHPGDKLYLNIDRVAKKAAEKNVLLEINPRHRHLNEKEIKIAMKYPVKFAVNSDAHKVEALGKVAGAWTTIENVGLPLSRVVNAEED